MKILIDECLPSELKETLTTMGHDCQTVRQAGFGSKKNGELLAIAEGRWEVLLTRDRNIKYQQNMTGRSVSIVILREGSLATYADLCSGASGHPTRSSGRRRSPLAKSSCNPSRLFHRTTAQLRASCLFTLAGVEGDLVGGNRSESDD